MAPILLLYSVLYFLILQSAMTEPLFSLLLLHSAYLFYRERYVAAALLASFLIYSRSEGMFMLVIFGGYLLAQRQWKSLPLLLFGFLLYSTIGYFSGHDFLWYFSENPLPGNQCIWPWWLGSLFCQVPGYFWLAFDRSGGIRDYNAIL